ncbi:MAG TPA: Trk system potassium transporter TrkA [Symbiobacteriaceae bacterium]|nr:Trk system potassium transporter TrkA [Symbiobacteriaceae bacterium]
MRAIIIGAGKLGYSVARMLSKDYDVYVIEQQPDRAEIVGETLDVRTIPGEWCSPEVLSQVDFANADLVVATTEVDEVNIVACLAAKAGSKCRTIARVRNPEYASPRWFGGNALKGIDLILSPERVTAEEIAKLVRCPEAVGAQYFAEGLLQLLELRVPPHAAAVGKPLSKIDFGPVLIAAIQRKESVLIPRGSDTIMAGDRVFVLARTGEAAPAEALLGQETRPVRKIAILGGGRIGQRLARLLEGQGISLTLIEKDRQRCQHLAGILNGVEVLHGDGADAELLREEGVGNADMFIATTADDKLNLLASLVAKDLGAYRTIATIRRMEFLHLVERVGIDVVLNPQVISAAAIQQFLRGSSELLGIHYMEGDSLHVLEFLISPECPVAGRKLHQVTFPRGSLVGGIFRADGSVILPSGKDALMPGDRAVILALPGARAAIDRLFFKSGLGLFSSPAGGKSQ